MIDFMVIGLPRSGTTWAANWLTDDRVFCIHDPLWTTHHTDWDMTLKRDDRVTGVACTGVWRWVDWVNRHPARKVVLHRDIGDVRHSLRQIGLPVPPVNAALNLSQIDGLHVPYEQLFDATGAQEIWQQATGNLPFDADRHAEMVQMNIQPQRSRLRIDPGVQRRIAAEVRQ